MSAKIYRNCKKERGERERERREKEREREREREKEKERERVLNNVVYQIQFWLLIYIPFCPTCNR